MKTDLHDAIRTAFDDIVAHTPNAGPRPTDAERSPNPIADRQRQVLLAAVFALIAGVGLVFAVSRDSSDQDVVIADGGPTTSLVVTSNPGPAIPGMSEISTSEPTEVSLIAALRLEGLLSDVGWDVELVEHATRSVTGGAAVQWAYFSDGDRRLFVVEGPTDLIDTSADLLESNQVTGGLSWPVDEGATTFTIQSAAGTVVVRSETIDGTDGARTLDELAELGQQLLIARGIDTRWALAITSTTGSSFEDGGSLERTNPSALTGPRSVVVRDVEGTLGSRSAVVTFTPDGTAAVDQAETNSSSAISQLSVPAPGGSVEVRAVGLEESDIEAIATATEIVAGRPIVTITPDLEGFTIVAEGTRHPQTVRQTRYGCEELGEPVLGALCYAGFSAGPGFEAAVYGDEFDLGPIINGHQSVISRVGGGNATLAWEPEPGLIAYIGYSGNNLSEEQADALARLANRSTFLSPDEWEAADPQTVVQANEW